jgi:hypothetical protein
MYQAVPATFLHVLADNCGFLSPDYWTSAVVPQNHNLNIGTALAGEYKHKLLRRY